MLRVDEVSGGQRASTTPWILRRWPFFAGLACLVVVLDQWSKFWVISRLTTAMLPEGEALPLAQQLQRFWQTVHPFPLAERVIFSSWCRLQYVENPGAAWGFLSRSDWSLRTPFFVAIALFAMGFLIRYAIAAKEEQWPLRFALAIVFGGALGNFIDRMRLGYVIDFIDWHVGQSFHWPTFNVADAGITVGVLMLMLDASRERAPDVASEKPPRS